MKPLKGDLHSLKKLQKTFVKQQAAKAAASRHRPTPPVASPLTQEDVSIFHQALKGVVPLADSKRLDRCAAPLKHPELYQAKREQAEGKPTLLRPKRPPTRPTRKIAPREIIDDTLYLADGMGKDILKKLTQFYWPIQASIDLHGATLEQAAERFDRFVNTCIEHHIKCFLIIHGKGHGSVSGKPILKPHLQSWLRQIDNIAAFTTAPDTIGGEGALLVLTKAKPSL